MTPARALPLRAAGVFEGSTSSGRGAGERAEPVRRAQARRWVAAVDLREVERAKGADLFFAERELGGGAQGVLHDSYSLRNDGTEPRSRSNSTRQHRRRSARTTDRAQQFCIAHDGLQK